MAQRVKWLAVKTGDVTSTLRARGKAAENQLDEGVLSSLVACPGTQTHTCA